MVTRILVLIYLHVRVGSWGIYLNLIIIFWQRSLNLPKPTFNLISKLLFSPKLENYDIHVTNWLLHTYGWLSPALKIVLIHKEYLTKFEQLTIIQLARIVIPILFFHQEFENIHFNKFLVYFNIDFFQYMSYHTNKKAKVSR